MSKINKVKEYVQLNEGPNKIWTEMGVFEGIPVEHALALARKLNEMIVLLSHSPGIIRMVNGDTMVFPIIIRAYRNHGHIINSCPAVVWHINSRAYAIEDFRIGDVDAEAEFCALMAEEIANLKL